MSYIKKDVKNMRVCDIELEKSFLGEYNIDMPLTEYNLSTYLSAPFIEVCKYLLELNIHTISCGCGIGEDIQPNMAGVSIGYDDLSEENKKICDKLVKNGIGRLVKGYDYKIQCYKRNEVIYRLDIPYGADTTVEQLSKQLLSAFKKLKFKLQDNIWNTTDMEDLPRFYKKIHKLDLTLEQAIKRAEEDGDFVDRKLGRVWDIYGTWERHLKYLESIEKKDGEGV